MFNTKPKDYNSGALEDFRSADEKEKDFLQEELVAAYAPVNFSPTSPDQWRIYPKRDQDGSLTCVAQTIGKMGGIMRQQKHGEFIEFSAAPIYNERINKPSGGMVGVDALNIWRRKGVTLEHLVPSQRMNESQVAAVTENEYDKQVGELSTIDKFVLLKAGDFDAAVSTMIATGKPLMVWFKCEYDEWGDVPVLIHAKDWRRGARFQVHHSVTATPNIGIYQGKQGFTIEDSWGSAGIKGMGVRFITREFYEARNTFAAYVTSFKSYEDMDINPAKPKHSFTRNLEYGMRKDEDVIALQDILKYEGLFPANQSSTGNFYEITRRAVLAWQNKHGIDHDGYYGRLVGTDTRKALNRMYSR